MKLKIFEGEIIPEEIREFYDDLAIKYLKSEYTFGKEKKGPIVREKIGRYLLSQIEIYSVEPNIELGFLIYTKEGHETQDKITIYYDKYVISKELNDIFTKYSGQIFEIQDIPCIEKNSTLKDVEKKKNYIKVTPAGILIATHIFGIRKVKKFFNKEANYCKDKVPLSSYIDDKNYDVSFVTNFVKEKKVIPDVKEKDKEIDTGKDFVGQKSGNLEEQLKKLLEYLSKKDNELLDKLKKIIKPDDKNDKTKEKKEDKLLEEIKKIIKPNDQGRNPKIVDDNEKTRKVLKEKFEKDYGDKKYTKYFEDTTNAKVDKKEKKVFNEVLKAVDKNKKSSIINQENFDKYRELIPIRNMKTLDFLYDLCVSSTDPLETLEKSLCFLSCKYENEKKLSHAKVIAKNIFKSKLKNYVTKKIEEFSNVKFPEEKSNYLLSLGLADVDDIRFDFKKMKLKDYPKTKHYRFLKLFKDEQLVSKSYSLNKYGKRNYKRARRFLDNMLIGMVKSMTNVEEKFLDSYPNDRENILRNYILYLDELKEGLVYEDYSFLKSIKPFNITNMVINLIKSDKYFKEESLQKISDLMQGKIYHTYTKNNEDEKIKKCFPTSMSLEYNMRIRRSYNIYNFYYCVYGNEEKILNDKIVCSGASIKCSMSLDLSKIISLNSKKYIDSKACLTIKDKNVIPFKVCNVNKVCTPTLTDWDKKTNIEINGVTTLMSNSKCMCNLGGVLTIVDPNQNSSNLKEVIDVDNNLRYKLDDYKEIRIIYSFLEKTYFSKFSRYIFKNYLNIISIEKICAYIFRKKFRPKYDEKKLESIDTIPVVDNDKKAIINIKPLIKILKGYFMSRLISKNFDDKWLEIGRNLKNETRFLSFIKKAKNYLPIIYSPYEVSFNDTKSPIWIKKAFMEYERRYRGDELNERVKLYHKLGGGILADIRTPWCASFVNYILDIGFKSASSQSFYKKEGRKYFKKIKKAKYGAILVLNYGKDKGHCCFIIGEDDRGYYCLGGNQGKIIKKSYFLKNNKIQGIYWPC